SSETSVSSAASAIETSKLPTSSHMKRLTQLDFISELLLFSQRVETLPKLSDSLLGKTLKGAVGDNSIVIVIVTFRAGGLGFALLDPITFLGFQRLLVSWL